MTEFEQLTIQQAHNDFILSIIVAIITFISVLFIYLDYRNRKSKEKATQSILLAKEFSEIMVYKLSLITHILDVNNISKIPFSVKFTELKNFDTQELNAIFKKEDIENFMNFIKAFKFKNSSKSSLKPFITQTLNRLEYMCMYISNDVADGTFLYNSLHQMFLQSIQNLYICIAIINEDNKDKYYTNIIFVYNLWTKKYLKDCKKEDKLRKKLMPKISKTK